MKVIYMPSGNNWLVLSYGQVGSSKSYISILMNGAREVTFLMPINYNVAMWLMILKTSDSDLMKFLSTVAMLDLKSDCIHMLF